MRKTSSGLLKKILRAVVFALLLISFAFPGQTALAAEENKTGVNELGLKYEESYAIVPLFHGKVTLDVSVRGGYIQMYHINRNLNQAWYLRPYEGYYYIVSAATGQVMTASRPESLNGSPVVQQPMAYKANQLWKIVPYGDGSFCFQSKVNEGYVLDVPAYGGAGTHMAVYALNGGANQRFRFLTMSEREPVSSWGADRSDCYGSNWSTWDGSSDNSWYYANKKASVFTLKTAAQLAGLSQLVRDKVDNFSGRTILLASDINLAGIEWRRIGAPEWPFKGSFNGQGHAIVGLKVSTAVSSDGFFGYIDGGCISNFAIKGSVSGDYHTGGVVGELVGGHLVNIYSEVTVTQGKDDNAGGICGKLHTKGMIDHCTQNGRVNSGDQDPNRGGIAGLANGLIRHCVNKATVDCNWDCVGGIAGGLDGGRIEFCLNSGTVCGGGDTQYAGGIAGKAVNSARIFGCINTGKVYSTNDDQIGGIAGQADANTVIFSCVNLGRVYGDDKIGGIVGEGDCFCCLNIGAVTGDDDTGATAGKGGSMGIRALSYSAWGLGGDSTANDGAWANASDIISGRTCHELNNRTDYVENAIGEYKFYGREVFRQTIGADEYPAFSGQVVQRNINTYQNQQYEVVTSSDRAYGTIEGGGLYTGGKVVLKAVPADGCVFERFEVSQTVVGKAYLVNGETDYPRSETRTYTDEELTLTENIRGSYLVKAVFSVYDETPADMKQTVRLEIECVDDTDGWNSEKVPIYLVDSAGDKHLWEVDKDDLDGDGKKVSRTFNLGTASPVSVEVYPDFGGGLTFHDLGLKARMWLNGSQSAVETAKEMVNSYPFISSKYGNDYLQLNFSDVGNATVGILKADGSIDIKGTYTSCHKAWEAAQTLGSNAVIRMDSVWLTQERLTLGSGKIITLDLNGFPLIRAMKKTKDDGDVIRVESGAVLNVIDTKPGRKSSSAFLGGSIQGGRSDNGGGLIELLGTLNMTGGALFNGGCTEQGGAVNVNGGTLNLKGTLISDCWANKATFSKNNGGAINVGKNGKVSLENVTIRNCHAGDYGGAIFYKSDAKECSLKNVDILACKAENYGGGIYQEDGTIRFEGGSVKNCEAVTDHGGAIYQCDDLSGNGGQLYVRNVSFEHNECDNNGGAVYCDTSDINWFIGCTFTGNKAGSLGGAFYQNNNDHLYLEDCRVTANASRGKGGGFYTEDKCTIDVFGKVIIRDNDGEGDFDNLLLKSGSYFYDQGLAPGSEIWLRGATSAAGQTLSENNDAYKISEYQMNTYLRGDHIALKLTETKVVTGGLTATAFVSDNKAIIIAGGLIVILPAAGAVVFFKKRKGGKA